MTKSHCKQKPSYQKTSDLHLLFILSAQTERATVISAVILNETPFASASERLSVKHDEDFDMIQFD